jgi:hypothetical protein
MQKSGAGKLLEAGGMPVDEPAPEPGGRKKGRRNVKDPAPRLSKGEAGRAAYYSQVESKINADGFYNIVKESDWDMDKTWINSTNYGRLRVAVIVLALTWAGLTAFLQLSLG